jgi:hypothetical protein
MQLLEFQRLRAKRTEVHLAIAIGTPAVTAMNGVRELVMT